MQIGSTLDATILGGPGIVIGLIFGYALAGMTSLNASYRIGLGVIVSFFGGLITSLLFMSEPITTFIAFTVGPFEVLLIIVSYFGGYALGAIANWAPLPEKPPKRHIVYEPEDDDEFDRELEEAMGGSGFKANNS